MLEVTPGETVDFLVDAGAGRFPRRTLHPNVCELLNVQFPYLVIPVPLRQGIINLNNVSGSPGCESAESLFGDVALPQFTAYLIESQGLQRGDIVLLWGFVRSACSKGMTRGRYRLYLRVGRWTLGTVWGPYHQGARQSLRSAICDSHRTQTARTRSLLCRDTSETLGTCRNVNKMPGRFLVCTHVTNAMSGIFTTFPFSMYSSCSSRWIFPSPPGTPNGSTG